ncbi:MAG: AAA family ATPase [Desulfobacterales bacterium]|nr:AAA family ATPase [Desulfobacterales bacterium]
MYKEYFLMQSEPFAPFPSPRLFFKSRVHENAWKNLVYCLKRKEPVVMTAGEYGTGKTLLCLKLIQFMEKNNVTPMVYIPSPGYSFSMLLEKIARELGLPADAGNLEETQRFIYEYFENDPPERNRYIYIIIDDIQEFDHEFVAGLTRLITYNNYGYFPLRLFMFGHTGFLKKLDERNLVSFRQRIKRVPLQPLGVPEVTEYIYFRLIASGASGSPVFNETAIELITSASKGLPRLINKICDSSLLIAYKRRANFIDEHIVSAALVDAGLAAEPDHPSDRDAMREVSVASAPQPAPQPGPQPAAQPATQTEATPAAEPRQRSRRVVSAQAVHPPDTPVPVSPAANGVAATAMDGVAQEPVPQQPRMRAEELFKSSAGEGKEKPKKKKQKELKKSQLIDGKTAMIGLLIAVIILLLLFLISGRPLPVGAMENLSSQSAVIMRSIPEDGTRAVDVLVTKPVVRRDDKSDNSLRLPPIMDAGLTPNDRGVRTLPGVAPVIFKSVEPYNTNANG